MNEMHLSSGFMNGVMSGFVPNPFRDSDIPFSSVILGVPFRSVIQYTPKSKEDQKKLQEDLTKLERWADIWGVKFNPSKCSVLRVKIPRAKKIANSDYQLKGVTLEKVSNSPYLGVSISENLEWGDHISKIASKANSTLGFLRRNSKGCPSK